VELKVEGDWDHPCVDEAVPITSDYAFDKDVALRHVHPQDSAASQRVLLGHPQDNLLFRNLSESMLEDNFSLGPSTVGKAQYIIVVEKDAIFQRLLEDRFHVRVPSVLVTGKGFPSLATRAFVHKLYCSLNIPVLGIADYNYSGVQLLLSYKVGSQTNPYEAQLYPVPLKWVGLHQADIAIIRSNFKGSHENECAISNHHEGPPGPAIESIGTEERNKSISGFLSKRDTDRTKKLLEKHPFLKDKVGESWAKELHYMVESGIKVELEALYRQIVCVTDNSHKRKREDGASRGSHKRSSSTAFSDWLEQKIMSRRWLE
jgi:hypothetical protein